MLVLGHQRTGESGRDDRFVPSGALAPVPAAVTVHGGPRCRCPQGAGARGCGRRAGGGAQAAPAQAPHADRVLGADAAAASRSGAIPSATYATDTGSYNAALSEEKHLSGTRRAELDGGHRDDARDRRLPAS